MGNEHQSADGRGAQVSLVQLLSTASWRVLGTAGAAGAALGLAGGILIGRATSDVTAETSALKPAAPMASADAVAAPPPAVYRAALGRRLPGKVAKRMPREVTSDKRHVARIGADEASLRLAVQPAGPSAYALTGIAKVAGPAPAKLQTSWDGKNIGTWDVGPDWTFYSTPIPPAALGAKSDHALRWVAPGVAKESGVLLDSVAVLPVENELRISMGSAESVGHLVSGFSKPDARSVWSNGSKSVIAGVLNPSPGPYQVTIRAAAHPQLAPITVKLLVNGKDAGSASIAKKAGTVSWAVPGDALHTGPNTLTFEYPQTFQPSKAKPGSKDERVLAVRFFSVDLGSKH